MQNNFPLSLDPHFCTNPEVPRRIDTRKEGIRKPAHNLFFHSFRVLFAVVTFGLFPLISCLDFDIYHIGIFSEGVHHSIAVEDKQTKSNMAALPIVYTEMFNV